MSIEGRITVDVNFTDTDSGAAVSVKRIQLAGSDSYSSGKVIVLSGTVGTSSVSLAVNPSTYRGADGSLVSFTTGVTRYAFASDSATGHYIEPLNVESVVFSKSSRIGLSECAADTAGFTISAAGTSGTAAYTAVFYGS